MNKLIIFDFNRTLFDPEKGVLMDGAPAVLQAAKAKGYLLVLLAKATPSREELIYRLGVADYFEEVILVASKRPHLVSGIAKRHKADPATSFVIGDRARGEVLLGHTMGWRTIWLRAGRFAGETPQGYIPEVTVSRLSDIPMYI